MSSIKPPDTRGAYTPGSVNDGHYRSLTDDANSLGQGTAGDNNSDQTGTKVSGKGGKAKGAHAHLAGIGAADKVGASTGSAVGAAADTLTYDASGTKSATNTGSSLSVLPDPQIDDSSATSSSTAVASASAKLTSDAADGSTPQATLTQDVTDLNQALQGAGVTASASQVIHDLIDPTGSGAKPSSALNTAAKLAGVDLSQGDSTDAAAAQQALTTTMQATPTNATAIGLATDHVIRTSGLAGADPATALNAVSQNAPSSNASGLAALFAEAAKNGVDLTDQGKDKASSAENAGAITR